MIRGAALRTSIACSWILASLAHGAERFDHRGALGLLAAGGVGTGDRISGLDFMAYAGRLTGMLGVTSAIGSNGNELKLLALAGRRHATSPAWSFSLGYRGYFGEERFKTFFDLDGTVDVTPAFAIGPRIGVGVQYELSSLVGVFAALAVHVGAGNGGIFGGDALVGFQIRSFLLE